MADQHEHQAPVGSVAEEAARLLDALGGWVSASGYGAEAPAAPPSADRAGSDRDAAGATGEDPTGAGTDPTGADAGVGASDQDEDEADDAAVPPGETRAHAAGHCEHCGAANGAGQAVTCQWCPVCQGIGLLRSVRPETVDRLADLAGALAAALRDVATHTRSAAGTPTGPAAPHDPRASGPRVQDITIEDDDQGSATR